MPKKIMLIVTLLVCALTAQAQEWLLQGIVRDSVTLQAVPYATISVKGNAHGAVAGANGIFSLKVPRPEVQLSVSSQGYEPRKLTAKRGRINLMEVLLAPSVSELKEVTIRRAKYSKHNNPAVDLMQRMRASASATDPERNEYYGYRKYERMNLGINDINPDEKSTLFKTFPFLKNNIDTSEVSGKLVLHLALKELASDVYWRRTPRRHREIVTGTTDAGIDEAINQAGLRDFMQDVLREIDVYSSDIVLLQNRFVSPLSPLAADFYKFYITDTVTIDGERAVQLSFYPHNRSTFGFTGQMYVTDTDSVPFVKRVTMNVPAEINLNFIEKLYINQDYKRAADGSRLKTRDDLALEASVTKGAPGLYVRRNVLYTDHSFDMPQGADTIFARGADVRHERDAGVRDSAYWQHARQMKLTAAEAQVPLMMERLRRNKIFYWGEKAVKTLANGYVATAKDSKFDVGPLNTFVSYNSLEGLRLRAGGMTTAHLSPHLFATFYGAWGLRDHRWKYGLKLDWSFTDKKYHSYEFPVHGLSLTSRYDVDRLGQHYLFTSPDNVFLALKRLDDSRITYQRFNELAYTLEMETGFSVRASVANDRQYESRLVPFALTGDNGTETPLAHFDMSYGELKLRWARGEKFYQTRTQRLPLNMDAPIITLTHRYGPQANKIGRWAVNRTELSVQKRFWFSAWGYLDVLASGGHVWSNNTPYTQLFMPNANLSYTIQPESFALMNPMEFVADSYATSFVTYWANGAILNYVPMIKDLKLREVFSASAYWGQLSNRNNPRTAAGRLAFPALPGVAQTSAAHTPYVEVSAGIDNLLKCIRVDYVWRVTHRWPGYPVDRSGPRIALHFTF